MGFNTVKETKKHREGAIKPQTLEKKAATRNSLLRFFLVVVIVLVQTYFIVKMITVFNQEYTWFATALRLVAVFLVLKIYSQDKTASVKMPWILLIMISPVLGSLLYLVVGLSGTTLKMRRRHIDINNKLFPLLRESSDVISRTDENDSGVANMLRYIEIASGYPAYDDSDIEFYNEASVALEEQKKALRNAKSFIFMEYFAIEDKECFREIKDILADKAAEGVDVRVFYDDMGSIGFINRDFARILREYGIKCKVFNPVTPLVNFFLNNRDHRKITVIDGMTAFTGGYNLANEYFNITHPYGRWKDTGVKVTGPAAANFTTMFLSMWNAVRGDDIDDVDCGRFVFDVAYEQKERGTIIQPYGDTPLDNENVGENVYMNIIQNARDYCWITTPYLIITDEMNHALCLAAERGVDVRIFTPGIPDKVTIYGVTKSYYPRLVKRGVKIYHYTPGFLHAKQCVSDDIVATCGTINLDYRSFYHNFENGVLFSGCSAVKAVKDDFLELIKVSEDVTDKYIMGLGPIKTLWSEIIRLFSALL